MLMTEVHLQQAPLLVLPAARAQRARATPNMVVKRHNLSERRACELASFARVLEQPGYNLREAVMYMRHLVAPACACVCMLMSFLHSRGCKGVAGNKILGARMHHRQPYEKLCGI